MLELPPKFNRRQLLKFTSLFAMSVGFSTTTGGCARVLHPLNSNSERDRRLKIGYLPITDSSPLLVAYGKGFYRAEGLEALPPQPYPSWSAIAEAFTRREVDVIHLLMPATVWLRYGLNYPGKVVAWNHTNGSALTVLPEIERPEDLGGRTVAIPFWYSLHNIILQILLRERGLHPTVRSTPLRANEVRLVVLPPTTMFDSLAKREIAGYIVAEPYNSAAETAGVGKLLRLTGDVWKDHACCVVFVREEDIAQRPEWTQKVVNAIVRAQHWSKDNRWELAHLLSLDGGRYMPYPVSVLERVLASHDLDYYTRKGAVVHPEWRANRIDFQPYPFPSYTRSLIQALKQTFIQDNIDFLKRLESDRAAADLVDDSFVRKALELVGGPQAFGLSLDLSRDEQVAFERGDWR